jgi:hypothetical protein
MAFGAKHKLGISGVLMLVAMSIFALFVAFIVVPMIAKAAGLHEQHVSYAVAGAAFVIAIVATRWAKALNKKAAEDKN